jgi:hypothetical protein
MYQTSICCSLQKSRQHKNLKTAASSKSVSTFLVQRAQHLKYGVKF